MNRKPKPYVRHPDDERELWRLGIKAVSIVIWLFWGLCLTTAILAVSLRLSDPLP